MNLASLNQVIDAPHMSINAQSEEVSLIHCESVLINILIVIILREVVHALKASVL